ncbi:GNAT family N-acetyltransferase [Cellulophaga sp. Z1A5H]|uniref:GNAT family N-acetyltransferase n=1 Tax=Cellulophaga sp. Z1A5H TaxID=2687291 RepID=UPI0013FDEEB1|nr:GNAT family N-acetyltransferase [Cellulophaga sp. Z1A5H]
MLETERVRFEPLNSKSTKDLESLFCENNLVMKSTLKGRVFTKKEFEELVENNFINSKEDNYGFRCIVTKSESKIIGVSGLHKFKYLEKEYCEFGFILNENYWGKGLASEIGNFWFNYAKNKMNLKELVATVSPSNKASRKVLEKLKMEHFAEFISNERGKRLILRKIL